MKPPSRPSSELCPSLHRQLKSYGLAASAAGVGILAFAQPAEAKIVYTRAHRVIRVHDTYNLDLNHDGKADFRIQNSSFCTDACHVNLWAIPVPAHAVNGVVGYVKGSAPYYLASALKQGARIPPGPKGHFLNRTAGMIQAASCSFTFCFLSGQWENVQDRYLGLKFSIRGRTHYGWARLNVQVVKPPNGAIIATLTGYAYETIPNKPITSGATQPSDNPTVSLKPPVFRHATLGMLAIGSPAVSIWRREESASGDNWVLTPVPAV